MMKKAAIALCAVLAVAACDGAPDTNADGNAMEGPESAKVMDVLGGTLYAATFNDGTECYVVDAMSSGALSCDFSESSSPTSGPAGILEQAGELALIRTETGDICAVYDGFEASGLDCRFN